MRAAREVTDLHELLQGYLGEHLLRLRDPQSTLLTILPFSPSDPHVLGRGHSRMEQGGVPP